MSAAPPPPPPPPPHKPPSSNVTCDDDTCDDDTCDDDTCDRLFNLLPAELLLMIINYAGVGSIMNLALAIYPTLQRHRIAPELSAHTYFSIVRVDRASNTSNRRRPLPQGLDRMPMELWFQVARDLEPIDILSMMFAIGAYPRGSRRHGDML